MSWTSHVKREDKASQPLGRLETRVGGDAGWVGLRAESPRRNTTSPLRAGSQMLPSTLFLVELPVGTKEGSAELSLKRLRRFVPDESREDTTARSAGNATPPRCELWSAGAPALSRRVDPALPGITASPLASADRLAQPRRVIAERRQELQGGVEEQGLMPGHAAPPAPGHPAAALCAPPPVRHRGW